MPSNKNRVASYLNDAEEKALKEFTEKEGMSNSEAVNFLIRKQLIEKLDVSRGVIFGNQNTERIENLEKERKIAKSTRVMLCESNEKLEEQIAILQEEVDDLRQLVITRLIKPISDEQIAAVTHQPEWKVRLWRHGQMKPRGKRIKENLKPFCVEDGCWKKREECG